MRLGALRAAAFGLVVAVLAYAAPASAQATRTWISGVGDDANPCSRTAPCRTFAGAISKTAAGGEIDCLDQMSTGTVTITKSITLDCSGTFGSMTASSTSGIIVAAGATDVVIVRGLTINGITAGLAGVRILSGASVTLENVLIQNFNTSQALGVQLVPSAATELYITNSTILQNGIASPAAGGGIEVAPGSAGSARVTIRNTRILNSANFGIRLNTSGTTAAAGIVATLDNVEISGGGSGLVVLTPANTTTASAMVSGTTIANNTGFGVVASGGTATVRIGTSAITGNGTGVLAAGGGSVRSFGTNQLDGNTASGSFTAPVLSPL